jgi:hypothetical protein
MFFLFVIALLQWLLVSVYVKLTRDVISGEISPFSAGAKILLATLPSALVVSPLLIDIYKSAKFSSGEPVSVHSSALTTWLFCVGGGMVVALYATRLMQQRRSGNQHFLSVGVNTMGFLCGLYILFAVADQWTFLREDENSGMVNWTFFQEEAQVADMHCNSDVLLVKGTRTETALYRCPTSFALGRFATIPFVPWPSYTEGESKQLAAAIQKLHNEAIKH